MAESRQVARAQNARNEQNGPVAGVTVLDLSVVGPASRCTRLLADYGAQVIKVGPVPGRGPAQADPPFFTYGGGRSYKKVCLDLRDPDGRDAFLMLCDSADVVVESFRPGVMARLGVGYAEVSARNPGIVYCSTSGYGQDGPRSGWAGHDIDYLAVSGFLAMSTPSADGVPPLPGATIADAAAGGMHAALSIMAALLARATGGGGADGGDAEGTGASGRGQYLDVAVADGALWLMSLSVDESLATGASPQPGHDVLSGRYACYATYKASDGRFLAVGAIEPKFFANLCRIIGCDRWIEDQYVDASQPQIRADFAAAFASKDRDTWVEDLAALDTCVAPVLEPGEVGDDAQYVTRGAFVEADHPKVGRFRQVAPLLAGMVRLAGPVRLPDSAVTDTEDLLIAAGMSQGAVEDLMKRGVVA
ncbi:MAG: CoA transferase [Acidimicrobiales bacterium]